jgi:uncharacterized GH25 family protein
VFISNRRKVVRELVLSAAITGWLLLAAGNAGAHFQVLLPETELLADEIRPIKSDRRLIHPAAGGPATQVIKADAQGVFCCGLPVAGWWGFAALIAEESVANPEGQLSMSVELGGLFWIHAHEPIYRRSR